MTTSHLTGRAIVASFEGSTDRLLIVEADIDCPSCGKQTLRIAGHHLRALRDLLIEFIDMHPELTGTDAGVTVIKRMQFTGRASDTPEDN